NRKRTLKKLLLLQKQRKMRKKRLLLLLKMHQLKKKLKLQKKKWRRKLPLRLLKQQQKMLQTQKKLKDNYYSYRFKKAEFMKIRLFYFFSLKKSKKKNSSLRIFEKWDSTKDEFLHTSNVRMRH